MCEKFYTSLYQIYLVVQSKSIPMTEEAYYVRYQACQGVQHRNKNPSGTARLGFNVPGYSNDFEESLALDGPHMIPIYKLSLKKIIQIIGAHPE